jgi:integrase
MSVSLREKPIKDGKEKSLYLDFYPPIKNPRNGKLTRREFLGIYIQSKPVTEAEKELNKEKKAKAEALRGLRELEIINEKYNFIDKSRNKQSFLNYFNETANKKDGSWQIAYTHFFNYTNGACTVGDVTVELANGFRDYLLKAKVIRHDNGGTIKNNTALSYYGKFRALLKQAYKQKLLDTNINDYIESIKEEETEREFVTLEELLTLSETPCDVQVLKRAALFSSLTGLRFSDIAKLVWEEIRLDVADDPVIRFRQKKTKGLETMPISLEALELCGERSEPSDKVFRGFEYKLTQTPLKRWILQAGIQRNITFHCFRHTYATLQLEANTDIYTIQKMLGHRKIETTMVYAKLLDEKKKQTTNKISLKRTKKPEDGK